MSRPLWFVDMDGVLADYVGGVEKLYHMAPNTLKKTGVRYGLHEEIGVSYGQMSNYIREASRHDRFWFNLDPLPWAKEFARVLNFRDNAFILTSPWPGDPQCYAQKIEWCMHHLGIGSDHVIPFPHKHLLAAPGRFLVDDLPKHCTEWAEAGGQSYVFPCQHNGHWHPAFLDEETSLREIAPALLNLINPQS